MSKILVVASSLNNFVEQIKQDLKPLGFDVFSCSDGVEALRLLRRKKPVVALLDDDLPRMDGYKACRFIKFDNKYRRIKVFILTQAVMREAILVVILSIPIFRLFV